MKKPVKKVFRKTKSIGEKIYRIYMFAMISVYLIVLGNNQAYAGGFGDSVFATGTKNLVKDIGTFLLILAPISGGVLGVYFFIRRQAADEMDQKKWNDRIKVTVISTIGAVLVSAAIVLLASYYGVTVDTGIK
jgi:heme/copper-type cytochrome/quinol oxidase subunit 2